MVTSDAELGRRRLSRDAELGRRRRLLSNWGGGVFLLETSNRDRGVASRCRRKTPVELGCDVAEAPPSSCPPLTTRTKSPRGRVRKRCIPRQTRTEIDRSRGGRWRRRIECFFFVVPSRHAEMTHRRARARSTRCDTDRRHRTRPCRTGASGAPCRASSAAGGDASMRSSNRSTARRRRPRRSRRFGCVSAARAAAFPPTTPLPGRR